MNNGQPKKMAPSDAERLSEMERKYDFIREKIQTYDKFVQTAEDLKNQFLDLAKEPKIILDKLEEAKKWTKDNFLGDRAKISGLEQTTGSFRADLNKIAQTIGEYKVKADHDAEGFGLLIKDVENRLASLIGQKGSYKDLQDFKTLHEEQISTLRLQLKTSLSPIDEINQQIEALIDHVAEHETKFVQVAKDVQAITIWLNSFEDKIKKRFDEFSESQNVSSKNFQEKVRSDLKASKEEILGTPTSNAAVEARIMNRLEMATLDGSNAVTIARQAEQKIKLLEKKIDSLSLQLSKFELTK